MIYKFKLYNRYFISHTLLITIISCITFATRNTQLLLLNIISIMAILAVFDLCIFLFKKSIRREDYTFTFLLTAALVLAGLSIYTFFVINRVMLYESDHTVYYDLTIELWALFKKSQIKGLAGIVLSCWHSDYSYLICVFLSSVYSFMPHTHEMFILSYYALLIVPTYITFIIFAYSIAEKAKISPRKMAAIFGICMLLFPLPHFASLLGMPDIFGLFFCFSTMIILINNRMERYDFFICLLISVLTIILIYIRRWYLFWIIGFLPVYFVLPHHIKGIKENTICLSCEKGKNALGILVISGIMLSPFIYHNLINRHYSEEYSQWMIGGMTFELYNQVGYLGILFAAVLLIGFVYGLFTNEIRDLSLTSIIGFVISIFLFTRIQNMGKHQSLLLVPYYSVFLCNYIVFSLKKKKFVTFILVGCLVSILLLNGLSSILVWHDDLNGLFLFTKYAISSRFTWNLKF